MKVIGIEGVNRKLQELANRSKQKDSGGVIVGYTQHYAVYVHEDLRARHKPGKEAKFLERPVRELSPLIPDMVAKVYWVTQSLIKGLLVAGLRIQRESQKLVPIDTSALKASAFTATDKAAPAAAAAAQSRANAAEAKRKKRT